MRFGAQLRKSIYSPWKDKYIDYDKLKHLLKEDKSDAESPISREDSDWTEEDEGAFVEELVNVQLEKVHDFQAETVQKLRDRISKCEARLEPLAVEEEDPQSHEAGEGQSKNNGRAEHGEERERTLQDALTELDSVSQETKDLEKYSRINYTGFLKAAKKHDRKRGHDYRVRPLLQVRLAALPFNQEDYSPILYQLSALYSFVRQNLEGGEARVPSLPETQPSGETYRAYKFWVHPENLLEVKTMILRRLPVLVFNPQTSKVADGTQRDPTITSIYFDNPRFSLYANKVAQEPDPASLRLRWYGQLSQKPEILVEKKVLKESEMSEEQRFSIKDKYVQSFIKGDYKMEKTVNKLKDRLGKDATQVKEFEKSVDDIQTFLRDDDLQPVLRANYTRTAFQIPGDDRVRISLDTDLALIREDAIDVDRPCRDPDDWHRRDIDDNEMQYPFSSIRKGEINRFPFAILEIKLKSHKQYEWANELMNSHLVYPAPRFSKFVHGVAQLFEDNVNIFPFWLSALETDIRRDPEQAFKEEQESKAKVAEDELALGSLIRSHGSPSTKLPKRSPIGSPANTSSPNYRTLSQRATAEDARRASIVAQTSVAAKPSQVEGIPEEDDSDDDGPQADRNTTAPNTTQGIRSLFPGFSTSRYARSRRGQEKLPPGVYQPDVWIKDQGPLKVEPKVWLANQRTFIKWQHVAVLLASLSLGLFNAAGVDDRIARALAVAYILLAVFAGAWGWGVYTWRSNLIRKRSGRDFDAVLGPCIVCIGLIIALILNFGFKYHAAVVARERQGVRTMGLSSRTWNSSSSNGVE
ncbi:SPX-domain-containing protein [Viridothelium virens]|uniref:SPX-domain-containing protein n=1 Tax=Viridothelium virens TaxID=1048519 RepID=A0A6A6HKA8_VIRVR|nr:SPX-domain-containing protein [Viridothelium virens]